MLLLLRTIRLFYFSWKVHGLLINKLFRNPMQPPCVITQPTKTKKNHEWWRIPLSVIELRYFRTAGGGYLFVSRGNDAPRRGIFQWARRGFEKGSPWMDRSRPWNRREVTSAKSCGFSEVSPRKRVPPPLSLSLSLFSALAVFLLLNGSRKLKTVHTPIEFSFRREFLLEGRR